MVPPGGVLALLGAVLLLTSGADICPAVRKDVSEFLHASQDQYVATVSQYRSEPIFLQNAKTLKMCVDAKLTAQDKALVDSALEKIYSSQLC